MLRKKLEEMGLEPDKIDEIMHVADEAQNDEMRKEEKEKRQQANNKIAELEKKKLEVDDWRKRAAISAKIVSLNLDNY